VDRRGQQQEEHRTGGRKANGSASNEAWLIPSLLTYKVHPLQRMAQALPDVGLENNA